MSLGVLYWYAWAILLPKWKRYRLEEEAVMLDDGTTITKFQKIPKDQSGLDVTLHA